MKTLISLTQTQRRVHWWPRWEQESGRRPQSVEPSWSSHCRRICFFQEKPPIFSWELISFSYGETPWETKSCVCWSDCIRSLSWAHYHLQESSRESKMWGEPHQKYIQYIYVCKYSSDQDNPLHQPQSIKMQIKDEKSATRLAIGVSCKHQLTLQKPKLSYQKHLRGILPRPVTKPPCRTTLFKTTYHKTRPPKKSL